MTSTKERQARSGNSEPANVEENRRAAKNLDKKDYSDSARVYVMSASRVGRGVLPKPELGKTERRVINAGVQLARTFDATTTPLPLQYVATRDERKLYFGKQFALERDITDSAFADELLAIVEEGTIQYIAVMLDGYFPQLAYITYGREDRPEFFATVYFGGGGDSD